MQNAITLPTKISTLSSVPKALWLCLDNQGVIRYVSKDFLDAFDIPAEALLLKKPEYLETTLGYNLATYLGHAARLKEHGLHPIKDSLRDRIFEAHALIDGEWQFIILRDATQRQQLHNYIHHRLPTLLAGTSATEGIAPIHAHKWFTVSAIGCEPASSSTFEWLEEVAQQSYSRGNTFEPLSRQTALCFHGDATSPVGRQPWQTLETVFQLVCSEKEDSETRLHGIIATDEAWINDVGFIRGRSCDLVASLARLAHPRQILITENTWHEIWQSLPDEWQVLRARMLDEGNAEVTPLGTKSLPESLQRLIYVTGPRVQEDPTHAKYYFRYKYLFSFEGKSIPILEALLPEDAAALANSILTEVGPAQPPKSNTWGNYRLLESISQTAHAETWRAVDHEGTLTLCKMFWPESVTPAAEIARQQRAATILTKLRQPSLCRIGEVGKRENRSFITMEDVEGVSLYSLLSDPSIQNSSPFQLRQSVETKLRKLRFSENPQPLIEPLSTTTPFFPVSVTLHLAIKTCEAIQLAHEHGILHRNLNPTSILIRTDGEPVITDFSHSLFENLSMDAILQDEMKAAVEFTAPEILQDRSDVDERADVYSIGALLYRLFTGHPHFQSTGRLGSNIRSLEKHAIPDPLQYNPILQPEIRFILEKALHQDRDLRYHSIGALQDDLRHIQLGKFTSVQRETRMGTMGRFVAKNTAITSILAGIVAILAVANVGTFFYMHRKLNEQTEARLVMEEKMRLILAQEAERAESFRKIAPSMLALAEWKVSQGAYEEALAHAQASLRFDPDLPEAYISQAQIYIVQRDFHNALNALETYFRHEGKSPYAHALADICYNAVHRGSFPMVAFAQVMHNQGSEEMANAALKSQETILASYAQKILQAVPDWRYDVPAQTGWPKKVAHQLNLKLEDKALALLEDGTFALQLGSSAPKDLSFLENIPVSALSLAGSNISDLWAIKTLSLKALNISNTRIIDLWPLEKMPLQILVAQNTAGLEDISALKSKSLSYLAIDGSHVKDFSSLYQMPLTTLTASMTSASDLAPLAGAPLEELDLTGIRPTTLTPLKGMPLKKLSLEGDLVRDLSPLAGMPLTSLKITNLASLDLSPLSNLPIKYLLLEGMLAEDIAPLQSMPVEFLDLSRSAITTISPLKGMPLKWLRIQGTRVEDLSPLAGSSINALDISNTQVENLWPLRGAPLHTLAIQGSRVSNLMPIGSLPLQELVLTPSAIISGFEVLRSMKTLARVGTTSPSNGSAITRMPVDEFWKIYQTNGWK